MKRKRKRRVTSRNLCSCGHFNCDPMMSLDTPAHRKIQKRLQNGECMGCGKKIDECSCKHKGVVDWDIPVTSPSKINQ